MLLRNTRLEISLDKLHSNVQSILNSKQDVFFAFVLKANAYGHGLDIIVKELNQYDNIEMFAVATLNEAIKVSKLSNKPIFIMGFLEYDLLEIAIEKGFYVTIFSFEQIKHVTKPAKVFIKVDTGFHRLGGYPSPTFLNDILMIHEHPMITILGIFTHLRLISPISDDMQIKQFQDFVTELGRHKISPRYISISDGISVVRHPKIFESMVRVGAMIYGLYQEKDGNPFGLQPIATLKTKITRILQLEQNSFGYSTEEFPNHPLVATIGVGYADGLIRNKKQSSFVVIRGVKCPIINVIGMDQMTIDISSLKEVFVGDDVIIFGESGISIEEFSTYYSTNKNEIISSISSRVPRVYIQNNEIKYIVDELVGDINEY